MLIFKGVGVWVVIMLDGRRMGTGLSIGVGLGVTLEYSRIHKPRFYWQEISECIVTSPLPHTI